MGLHVFPILKPPSQLPPHPILLGHPSAPAPSILYHASNLDCQFVSHMIIYIFLIYSGFLDDSVVENPPAKARDARDSVLIPGPKRSPGERNGNPLEYPWSELLFGGLMHFRNQTHSHESCYIDVLSLPFSLFPSSTCRKGCWVLGLFLN